MTRILRSLFAVVLLAGTSAVPARPMSPPDPQQTAILAGGCFWCVQSDFDKLKGKGVTATLAGYTGGTIKHPTYGDYHDAGPGIVPHVEAVEVTFDPRRISYRAILEYYVHHIDPLDGGGQFCDRGPSYRPVIFTADAAQTAAAKAVLAQAQKALGKPLQVQILPARTFWPAERYHQEYYRKNPLRYEYYRWSCGRDRRVEQVWGGHRDH